MRRARKLAFPYIKGRSPLKLLRSKTSRVGESEKAGTVLAAGPRDSQPSFGGGSRLVRRQADRVTTGATKPEQVEQNVRAASWALTEADMQEIDRLTAR